MTHVILAAGGVVHRVDGGRLRYALVHRTRHRDWVLPKGKLEPMEGFRAAAVREVLEEASCDAAIEQHAGVVSYVLADGRPKMVVFYGMHCERVLAFSPTEEIDAVVWCGPREAAGKLSYADERELLRRVTAVRPVCTKSDGARMSTRSRTPPRRR